MLERRSLSGGVTALVSPFLQRHGFLVAFTERTGGVSARPFDALNLSPATGDDPSSVMANRTRVCRALDIEAFAVARQVHGSTCVTVDASGAGAGFDLPAGQSIASADALATGSPGVALGMFVADCVPVALASPKERRVAAVHAGWRGLAGGVLNSALAAFDDAGSVHAVIGPAIGLDHYEVGEDVVGAVTGQVGAAAVVSATGGRLRMDLAATAARFLRNAGVGAVEVAGVCTSCAGDRFYSHRRDGAATGRQALIAVIRP